MLVVGEFERRIHASDCRKCLFSTVSGSSAHFHLLPGLELVRQTFNVENLFFTNNQFFDYFCIKIILYGIAIGISVLCVGILVDNH